MVLASVVVADAMELVMHQVISIHNTADSLPLFQSSFIKDIIDFDLNKHV